MIALGPRDDVLVQRLNDYLGPGGLRHLDVTTLFGSTPFSTKRCGRDTSGFLTLNGIRIPYAEIKGVVIRLPLTWSLSYEFDLQDRMFVYHETLAAWFSTISNLACPVFNRFGLGWWLQDTTYHLRLLQRLAFQLAMTISTDTPSLFPAHSLFFGSPNPCHDSAYLVGEKIIKREGEEDSLLFSFLSDKAAMLADWQESEGILLSRLDFLRKGNQLQLSNIDPIPSLHTEHPGTIDRIAKTIVDICQ